MDIAREGIVEQKRRRRIVLVAVGVVGLAALTFGVSRLKPAAPSVERSAVWIDTVKRGPMVRQVRGPGTLVPVDIRWIAARTDARVERIVLQPGTVVEPDSVILELSSPEVEQAAFEGEAGLREAEARLRSLEAQLRSDALSQEAAAAAAAADAEEARLRAEADRELNAEGLVSNLTARLSSLRADQQEKRAALEQQRVARSLESLDAQLAAGREETEQLRALARLRREQREALRVRAGLAGVLQVVPVEVGQQVVPGMNLARVARPDQLKAELRIAETQAKDVTVGQLAAIDTRNGIVEGRVARIDPSVREGTVLVDVTLTGALPRGARPDLSVDGTVELERLDDVLFVGRPAFGQPGSRVGLFRLDAEGERAKRTSVALGRSSVNTVEIVEGLAEGDRVILSDMAAWDAFDEVRLD